MSPRYKEELIYFFDLNVLTTRRHFLFNSSKNDIIIHNIIVYEFKKYLASFVSTSPLLPVNLILILLLNMLKRNRSARSPESKVMP